MTPTYCSLRIAEVRALNVYCLPPESTRFCMLAVKPGFCMATPDMGVFTCPGTVKAGTFKPIHSAYLTSVTPITNASDLGGKCPTRGFLAHSRTYGCRFHSVSGEVLSISSQSPRGCIFVLVSDASDYRCRLTRASALSLLPALPKLKELSPRAYRKTALTREARERGEPTTARQIRLVVLAATARGKA